MPTLAEIMAARKAGGSKPPAKAGSIKITPESDHAALAAKIKESLDITAPKPAPPLPNSDQRELGASEPGERIPMDHPPQGAPKEAWDWYEAMHSFASDLGIVLDPNNTEFAWLAVRANPLAPPLLLHRFPLINRPSAGNPF